MKPRKPPEPTPLLDYASASTIEPAKRLAALKTERKLEDRRTGRKGSGYRMSVGRRRLADILALIRHRCDGPARTDDADVFLRAAMPSLIEGVKRPTPEEVRRVVLAFREKWTPGVGEAAALTILCEVEADRLHGRKVHTTGDEAAAILNVSLAEMMLLRLRSINAIGVSKAKRKDMAKERDRIRKAAARAKAGAAPHAKSKQATKPWLALGIGRATYYARQKAGLIAEVPVKPWTVSSAIDRRSPLARTVQSNRLDDMTSGPDPLLMSDLPPLPPTIVDGAPPLVGTLSVAAQRLAAGPARPARANRLDGAGGHTPMAKTMADEAARTVAQPLPEGGFGRTLDLFCDGPAGENPQRLDSVALRVVDEVRRYRGGLLPPVVAMAVRDALKARGLRHEDFGRAIGVSRMQATNVLAGRFGLSEAAAVNLRTWYEAAAA